MARTVPGALESAVATVRRLDDPLLSSPYRETAENIRGMRTFVTYSDLEARKHIAFGPGFKTKLAIDDVHRFRLEDADGDTTFVGFPSSSDLSDFWEWQRRKTLSLVTDRIRIRILTRAPLEVEAPWRRKPIVFAMHGTPRVADVSLRRPARVRAANPDGHVVLAVRGATAADMLWETRAFQAAISKDPGRPVVGLICDAAKPPGVFAREFSKRMFEREFQAPIYFGRGDVGGGMDEAKDGTQFLFLYFDQTVRGQNPMVTFKPPGA